MNYWRDTQSGQVFYATVILTDTEKIDAPPLVVRVGDLLAEERFVSVQIEGDRYLDVDDSSHRS